MIERRFEGRFLCADLVRVDWLAGVNPRTAEAVLEDISPLGACVQVEELIPMGAAISISTISTISTSSGLADSSEAAARFTGWVSYCVYRDYGYFVGIRFSNETRWSSGVYEPQHLTNLGELILAPAPD
jgi:hypothetical protein